MSVTKVVPGKDGNKYIPFEERIGESSVVFFTRDLSEEGLKKVYDKDHHRLPKALPVHELQRDHDQGDRGGDLLHPTVDL